MDRVKIGFVLAPMLLLAACGGQQAPREQPSPTPAAPPPVQAAPSPLPSAPVEAPVVPELTPEAERGEQGARNVLLSFARAIEQRKFGAAWGLLSPADQRKWSRTRFAALFADLGEITVAVPTGEMEGAAGSSFYTAPVTITAPDRTGRPVRYEGEAVLRRVNDVDGSTPAQRRWHFERLTLNWTH